MALTCNIDSRGKAVRLIMGAINLVAGLIVLFAWAMRSGGTAAWCVTIGLLALGAFEIFEGWAGWCFIRALGFKTKV